MAQVVLPQIDGDPLGAAKVEHARGEVHAGDAQPGAGKGRGRQPAADAQIEQALGWLDEVVAQTEQRFGQIAVVGDDLRVVVGGIGVVEGGLVRHGG